MRPIKRKSLRREMILAAWKLRERTDAGYKMHLIVRQRTASRRLLPDFLIIGAQRSGTKSFLLALGQHPAITLASRPEVHYFDWNYERGIAWYRAHFPTRRKREQSLRRRGEFATGEKSPYYLFDPVVPARVRALLPDVKLIVLLRDPVARAFSHYQHERRHGREALSFEDALRAEARQDRRLPKPVDPHGPGAADARSYIARGRYAEQLERWLRYFDCKQIHVVLSERYFADPARTVCQIQEFIGLTPDVPQDLTPYGQAVYEPMPSALRRRLQVLFADDVRQLAQILGADPGWWQPPPVHDKPAGRGP